MLQLPDRHTGGFDGAQGDDAAQIAPRRLLRWPRCLRSPTSQIPQNFHSPSLTCGRKFLFARGCSPKNRLPV